MGKGDRKTKKGKIAKGTFGVLRPKKSKNVSVKPKARKATAVKTPKTKPAAASKEKKAESVAVKEKDPVATENIAPGKAKESKSETTAVELAKSAEPAKPTDKVDKETEKPAVSAEPVADESVEKKTK